MVVTEEYAIPDKMVGLSKSALLLPQDYLDIRVFFFLRNRMILMTACVRCLLNNFNSLKKFKMYLFLQSSFTKHQLFFPNSNWERR